MHVFKLGRAFLEIDIGDLVELVVGDGQIEAIAKCLERRRAHFLLLVGDVLRFTGLTHAVTLDGLGENHRRLARCVSLQSAYAA